MKGEEGNAERQRQTRECERIAGERVDRAEGKIRVLEYAEHGEVRRHGRTGDNAAPHPLGGADHQGGRIVEDDLADEQQDVDRFAPSVKQK
jgi:hypothetical protein